MNKPLLKTPAETEPTRQLVAARGGLVKSFSLAVAALKDGRVTRHARRMVRFGLVGVSGVGVNTAILYVLAEVVGLNHVVAGTIATETAILSNFLLNDRWTFGDAEFRASWPKRVLRYNSVALGGLVISISVLAGLTYWLGMHYLVANLFAIGAGTAWNYAGSSWFTWAAPKNGDSSPGPVSKLYLRGRRAITLMVSEVAKLWA